MLVSYDFILMICETLQCFISNLTELIEFIFSFPPFPTNQTPDRNISQLPFTDRANCISFFLKLIDRLCHQWHKSNFLFFFYFRICQTELTQTHTPLANEHRFTLLVSYHARFIISIHHALNLLSITFCASSATKEA